MVEFRRLSYQDGMFVRVGDGEREVVASEIDVVVVNATNISRLYYKNDYDPAHTTLPTCWSSTTQAPDELVPSEDKQATRCMDCTQNIKGSGSGYSRACRFVQRVAVVLDGEFDTVYQLQLPATAIFGKGKNNNKPLQEYAKFLGGRGTKTSSVVTTVYPDNSYVYPRLCFKPLRSLVPSELRSVAELKNDPATLQAIARFAAVNTSPFSTEDGFDYKNSKGELSNGKS